MAKAKSDKIMFYGTGRRKKYGLKKARKAPQFSKR